MRTGAPSRYTLVLALGLSAACASDLWYKQGAGTAALAQDKAACRAEVAQQSGAAASAAFEQCMRARDWFHVARGPAPSTPARAASVRRPAGSQRHGPCFRLSEMSSRKISGAKKPCERSGFCRHSDHR